uniref:Uncharacterized protein n=1 Tax=Vespula pensylvanica TaxID=30213 RepID=A0A834U436_VESPE|nr:hypothetical protein H0235_012422 [Vespula pensylvanica]
MKEGVPPTNSRPSSRDKEIEEAKFNRHTEARKYLSFGPREPRKLAASIPAQPLLEKEHCDEASEAKPPSVSNVTYLDVVGP